MKAARRKRKFPVPPVTGGWVMFLHPAPAMREELSKSVNVEEGVKLIAGEIGTIDCDFRIRVTTGECDGK